MGACILTPPYPYPSSPFHEPPQEEPSWNGCALSCRVSRKKIFSQPVVPALSCFVAAELHAWVGIIDAEQVCWCRLFTWRAVQGHSNRPLSQILHTETLLSHMPNYYLLHWIISWHVELVHVPLLYWCINRCHESLESRIFKNFAPLIFMSLSFWCILWQSPGNETTRVLHIEQYSSYMLVECNTQTRIHYIAVSSSFHSIPRVLAVVLRQKVEKKMREKEKNK